MCDLIYDDISGQEAPVINKEKKKGFGGPTRGDHASKC